MRTAIRDAETSFETKMKPLCELKREGPRPLEARQCRNPRVADGQRAKCVAGLAADGKAGDAAVDDRRAEPAAVGELVDEIVGNIVNRAVDQDLVVRRSVGMALLQRRFEDRDSLIARSRGEGPV